MTYDEVLQGVTGAMKNPDTMETTMQTVLDGIKEDYEKSENIAKELEKANNRIRDLQDTNHKLFLSQIGTPEKESEDTEKATGAGVLAEFKETLNSISNKEKEQKNG